MLLQHGGKGEGFLALLPGFTAAVSFQRVVDDMVVVLIFPCEDASSTGAAEWAGNKLRAKSKNRKQDGNADFFAFICCNSVDFILVNVTAHTYCICEWYPCITN